MNWLKYSGIWMGIVVNPYHWQFGWVRDQDVIFENCIHLGPFWIRVIIDNAESY